MPGQLIEEKGMRMSRIAMRLQRLRNDKLSTAEAAKTISQAFSEDPLIRWLRPGAQPWALLDRQSLNWQRRRVLRFNCEQTVFTLKTVACSNGAENLKALCDRVELDDELGRRFGTVAMIQPPKAWKKSEWQQPFLKLKLWVLDRLRPCVDPGGNSERIDILMQAHERAMEEVEALLAPQQSWYIEVVAVRPSQQGSGLGGKLMKAVIEVAGADPVVLECTDLANVAFYKRFGFEVVKSIVLEDPKCTHDSITLYLMLKK